jgi:hypothetical protein
MRRITILCILVTLSIYSHSQNNTIKLYLQQIAANKIYIEYLQKGYKIARNGLTTIGNIKNGHFNLDKDFFAGLQAINPKVRNYAKVADIIALNIKITTQYRRAMHEARRHEMYNSSELEYMGKVFYSLIEDCTAITDELMGLLTPDKFKMSDDERIKRIDVLHAGMQDNYVFVNSFSGDMAMMTVQRSKEAKDAATLRSFHGQ